MRAAVIAPCLVCAVSAHSIPSIRTPRWPAARSTQTARSSKSRNLARVVVEAWCTSGFCSPLSLNGRLAQTRMRSVAYQVIGPCAGSWRAAMPATSAEVPCVVPATTAPRSGPSKPTATVTVARSARWNES